MMHQVKFIACEITQSILFMRFHEKCELLHTTIVQLRRQRWGRLDESNNSNYWYVEVSMLVRYFRRGYSVMGERKYTEKPKLFVVQKETLELEEFAMKTCFSQESTRIWLVEGFFIFTSTKKLHIILFICM